ncbi:MAG TPA: hypothetical protein VHZ97_12670 [Pseudonocardiaceae bacterium]|nr:hypothetical protein [Pseudonocardiaceae bacterium]
MTPQRWKGAGVVLMVITVLLILAAVVSVIAVPTGPVAFLQYQQTSTDLFGAATAQLRAVVLGAFAGVSFFLSLACFMWSGLAEAAQQRAEILVELTALRARAEKSTGTEQSGS